MFPTHNILSPKWSHEHVECSQAKPRILKSIQVSDLAWFDSLKHKEKKYIQSQSPLLSSDELLDRVSSQ